MVIHHTPYILRNEAEVIAYLHYSLLEMGKGLLTYFLPYLLATDYYLLLQPTHSYILEVGNG